MIDAIYYQGIFLFIVAFFTFFCFMRYYSYGGTILEWKGSPLILAIALSFFIGFRPIHRVFADTVGYASYYNSHINLPFSFSVDVENILFDNLLEFMSSNGFSYSIFFLVIAFIYFIGRYISCRKMFPNNSWAAYLVFLGAFLTFASSVNGIKAGAAASIFVCAVAYKDNKILSVILLLTSWGFHHSMHLCILAFIAVSLYKNTKFYSLFWIFCLLVAIMHISYFQNLFAGLTDEKSARYLIDEEGWMTGMRYDFVLYSFIPILLGWYYRFRKKVEDVEYDFLLNLYMLINGLWLLCMYANFTNRIAALSWLLYPIVLIYPYFSVNIQIKNKNKTFSVVMAVHLLFTLFMAVVYY